MRLALNNILVVTEFPPWADKSVLYALQLARNSGSDVHIVHRVSPAFFERVNALPITDDFRQSWLNLFFSANARQFMVDSNELQPKLRGMLSRSDYQLVLVSIGHGETAGDSLCAAAYEILRIAECPVMVFGPGIAATRTLAAEPVTMLYATDFSPSAACAAQHASSWAQEFQSWLRVLHVVESVGASTEAERSRLEQPFRNWMGELFPQELALWCELEPQVDFGNPRTAIVQTARDCQADLLVIGMRGLDSAANGPGMTAIHLMNHAPCPVLVVRDDVDLCTPLQIGSTRDLPMNKELVA